MKYINIYRRRIIQESLDATIIQIGIVLWQNVYSNFGASYTTLHIKYSLGM